MLCTLFQSALDVRSAIGVEFYRCKSKDKALREVYKAAVGRAAKLHFRAGRHQAENWVYVAYH